MRKLGRKEAWEELARRTEKCWGLCSEIDDMHAKGLITGWRAFLMHYRIHCLSLLMRSAFVWSKSPEGNACRRLWCERQARRATGLFPDRSALS